MHSLEESHSEEKEDIQVGRVEEGEALQCQEKEHNELCLLNNYPCIDIYETDST